MGGALKGMEEAARFMGVNLSGVSGAVNGKRGLPIGGHSPFSLPVRYSSRAMQRRFSYARAIHLYTVEIGWFSAGSVVGLSHTFQRVYHREL